MIINSINYKNNPYLQESSINKERLYQGEIARTNLMCKSGANKRDKNEVINSGNIADKSEVAAISFKGSKFDKMISSDKFANFLTYIDNHNQTTNALVALVTAGMIRPTLTMAIPGMKDKKDKIYSATQAISSGFLGFGVTMALTQPLDDALTKVKNDPAKYNCKFLVEMNDKIKKLEQSAKTADPKELKNILKQKSTLELLVKNIPEWAICVPRAMLTIALIPLILKYVFGLEKKPKNPQQVKTEQPVQQQNFAELKQGKAINEFLSDKEKDGKQVNFKANPANVIPMNIPGAKSAKSSGLYDKVTDKLAKYITSPIINSSLLRKASDSLKDSDILFNHISTITSALISGVYVQRTLTNDNLEDDKKKVLATNQALTFAMSTILSYTVDSKLENWWQRLTAKFIGARATDKDFAKEFEKAQKEAMAKLKTLKSQNASKEAIKKAKLPKALDYAKSKNLVLPPNIKGQVAGLALLKKMVVIGSIFRLAVPLIATPLASYLEEIRAKKMESKQQAA